MSERQSNRRRFLQLTGAATLAGLAGCSGGAAEQRQTAGATTATETNSTTSTDTATTTPQDEQNGPRKGDDLPKDTNPSDGYPPEFDTVPEERAIDTSSYDTVVREIDETSVEVPLVSIEDAYYWYARGEARFVDSRSETNHDVSHIFGSVLSPAPDGRAYDPTEDWNKADRVVTYCQCPHYLSSLRAAALLNAGFEEVYAIEEGYEAWLDRDYPLAGSDTSYTYDVRTIDGKTSQGDANGTVWAFHPPTGQVEATKIDSDGSYTLELRFVQVDAQSTIQIETPSYAIQAPLGEVTSGTVTADTGSSVPATKSTGTNSTDATNTTSASTSATNTTSTSVPTNATATGDTTATTNTTSDDATSSLSDPWQWNS
ncbi:rhodanese-like domain-containing protein (plasmid) [Haloferax larsenii]|uniref:Rhodanese-like domain-containing protein n=1 Tax=Haloferax larsenii TaxID=302484 RepID=A0ABY5RM78_HALLR|nr:rhodanese-like domain-containing protein [Haloferax larsenii]UVE52113.1 rhodanese-like domain-containing protein [Haloferax larsenii]